MSERLRYLARSLFPSFVVVLVASVSIAISNSVAAQETAEFDPIFLNAQGTKPVDLSRFAKGASALPGVYKTALYVNEQFTINSDIEFKVRADKSVYPCLSKDLIEGISFNYEKLPDDFLSQLTGDKKCMDLQQKLPEAQVNFDSNEQRLDLVIPQVYMLNTARGTVSPELWDSGIPAILLGYNVNGYSSESNGTSFSTLFAGVNAGLNVGAWYLRHNGSYSRLSNDDNQYSSINTYLQRDIPLLKGRVLFGESNTTGQLFDTLPFTGVQLASDERMLPESLRGFAPDIRGIARTNARVTVRQGGQVLYETTVTPGEFLINDLYPTGYGGDLEVTVRESDGTVQTFRVPYASVAQLLRPGASRYAFTAGELRSAGLREKPALFQTTYLHGLTNAITGYGGVQASQDYYALQVGAAFGIPIGALSFDVTQARIQLGNSNDGSSDKSLSGQNYQLSYSKLINETHSNLSVVLRHSSTSYLDFLSAMQARNAVSEGNSVDTVSNIKNRLTLTAGQGLPENWGQLYISGSVQTYWGQEGRDMQYQVGYNNQYKSLSYGVSANRSYSSLGSMQTNFLISFSLPLGRSDATHTPQFRMDLTNDTTGRTGQQAAISGSMGKDNQFSYGVTAMNANQGQGASGTLSGNYRTRVTAMSGTYSTGKNYQSASAGLSGTVIGHSGGLTFTPYTSDTVALVEAKGAEGASVSSYPGVSVNSRGYAVVPYLNPYQLNEISLDPIGTAANVELDTTLQKVAPYSGAVVKVKYIVKRGQPVLIVATYQGDPVQFGADVLDSKGNSVGSVGQGGQIYARVAEDKGQLQVKWGDSSDMQCMVGYRLLPQAKNSPPQQFIQQFNSVCQ
ncbi:fimbria/pilus outer membrane usher protein [Serratia aquatilis]|uniref:Fimbria/pilus outer membrane usher protein n=1 Tax=Serratia aquatilis TaxID=1737515 RepID=A0ABV6EAV1_9GAMM